MATTSLSTLGICDYMGIYEDIMKKLEKALRARGEKARVSRVIGTPPNTLSRWFQDDERGRRKPSGKMLLSALDAVGVRIVFPDDKDTVGCISPEAAAIDRLIIAMRKSGEATDSTIKAAIISKVQEDLFKRVGTSSEKDDPAS